MGRTSKPLAVVTGAPSGIGYELALICAQRGFDLVIAADRPGIYDAASGFRDLGAEVIDVETDLSTLFSPTPGTGWGAPFWIRTSRPSGTCSTRTSPGQSICFTRSRAICVIGARGAFS